MPSPIIKSFAKKTDKTESEVEKLWKKAEDIVKKEYDKDKDDDSFYPIVVGILKRMLKIEESSFNLLYDHVINESQ